jgi:hypothetical protein
MRTLNRVLAALLSLALIALGLLVVAEIAWASLGQDPLLLPYHDWYRLGRTRAWSSPDTVRAAALLFLLGTLLVVLQLVPRRPLSLELASQRANIANTVSRRSLERFLARSAMQLTGVSGASAKITRRRARVSALTRRHELQDLRGQVEEVISSKLEGLHLRRPLRAQVTMSRVKE